MRFISKFDIRHLKFDTDPAMLSRFFSTANASRYGFLLLEVGLTVFGVLLGLAANEWRKAEAAEDRTQIALQTIRKELEDNLNEVEREIPYHESVRDSLLAARQDLSPETKDEFGRLSQAMPKGFTVAELRSNAWELANRTGALQNVDYPLAAQLAEVYGVQRSYQSTAGKMEDNLYVAQNVSDANYLIFALGNLVNDVLNREKRLRTMYRDAIRQLEAREP